ncbi:hypothetical protein EVAR_41409_1 [Eumeta japonica]|uniref:Uncharacterized protein n=1 Tax=Eumeta variegata TaxID=151549 RepID=A0A4C1W3H3_EUMVA|nr:hypothetical protein EVAR_41409_1 [Eumeta japonica]
MKVIGAGIRCLPIFSDLSESHRRQLPSLIAAEEHDAAWWPTGGGAATSQISIMSRTALMLSSEDNNVILDVPHADLVRLVNYDSTR